MQFIPPYDQIGMTPPGPWTNAAPQAGVQGSIVNADVFPAVQNEILAVITAAGLTPSATNLAQMLAALAILIPKYAIAGATAGGGLAKDANNNLLLDYDNLPVETAIGSNDKIALFSEQSEDGLTAATPFATTIGALTLIILANVTATQIFNITQQAAPGTGFTGHQEYTTFQPQGAATHTLSASFTAPARGNIQATSKLSTTAQPGLSNAIAIYVNGTQITGSADSVAGTITDTSNCTVNKGDAVQIVSTVTASQALAYNSAQYLDYFFIPS